MFTFLHAADIHLDSPLRHLSQYEGAPVEALRGATRAAFQNLVDLALSEPADFVLIAGDVYDGDWKDYNTGLWFVSRMTQLERAGIPVFLVAGNHDAASRMSKTLRMPANVHTFPANQPDTVRLDRFQVAIHGQSFAAPAVKKNLAAKYPPPVPGYFNIGLLHTCATGREGHLPYAPCETADLAAKGYDYWALGHVHQREVLSEDPQIVFPGNLQGRHIRETGPKGCMAVAVNGHGQVRPDFRPLDVIRWAQAEIDITGAEDGYAVLDILCDRMEGLLEENGGRPLAVRVILTGHSPAHDVLAASPGHWISQIRAAALDACSGQIWVEKVKIRSRPPGRSEKISDGPVGEILEIFDAVRSDPALLDLLEKSLNDLSRKLPRELRDGDDGPDPANREWLAGMVESVRPMLLGRLLSEGGEK
ncbi:DNA repair exonuclease [Desulfonema ishimotonii]|uniref:DNA repair exonuclease n=1 Tax=Desulfonema ishimotonii TaxID=45657 RepID=A0A401FWQ1_9BACT|nr:DNA repair exonuclease [Desulfonema ishimotonii]GBC61369.1 DNA repair exonuclease [Desulfonema ishimotonii]